MSGDACRLVWRGAAYNAKASALDDAFPNCGCEPWSLVAANEDHVADDEPLARILTAPWMYDEGQMLTSRLTQVSAGGVSLIRAGATDAEILSTIDNLLNGQADPQTLIGAAVFGAHRIRSLGDPEKFFGIYHTEAPGKVRHADILATRPSGTRSAQKKAEKDRRYLLRDTLIPLIVRADEPAALLTKLRAAGI